MYRSKPCDRVVHVTLTDDTLIVDIQNGRIIALPLEWYPQLLYANNEQRENWHIATDGTSIFWSSLNTTLNIDEIQGGPSLSCIGCSTNNLGDD
jgi:hypothetical protein